MNEQKETTYPTDNFALAAYLLAEGCTLLSVDKRNLRRAVFIFQESERRSMLSNEFFSYQSKVEPNRFYSAQRNLKQMLYEGV